MQIELTKEFLAEAAHRTARGLHGHSYRIEIVVAGEIDPALGWLMDYGDITKCFRPLYEQLDHHCLNEVEGMTDVSLRGVREWIWARLVPVLPGLKDVRVAITGDGAFQPVRLDADPAAHLPPRLRFTFEAAQSLPHLPEGHPCQRLHGHTYRVEIGGGDLEALRASLATLYDVLDHRCLNDVPGLESATSERLCKWIWDRLSRESNGLSCVIVQETATARCCYYGP